MGLKVMNPKIPIFDFQYIYTVRKATGVFSNIYGFAYTRGFVSVLKFIVRSIRYIIPTGIFHGIYSWNYNKGIQKKTRNIDSHHNEPWYNLFFINIFS